MVLGDFNLFGDVLHVFDPIMSSPMGSCTVESELRQRFHDPLFRPPCIGINYLLMEDLPDIFPFVGKKSHILVHLSGPYKVEG